MKKLAAVLFVFISFGVLSLTASADTLKLVGVGGASTGGIYIYPYNFSIDGSATTTPLMCIDFNLEITQGESWDVTISALPSATDFEADAILLYELQANITANAADSSVPLNTSDYQFAVWELMNNQPLTNVGFTAQATAFKNAAVTLAESGNPDSALGSGFSYSDFNLFAPISDPVQGGTEGVPQSFLGYFPPGTHNFIPTPEPSSLMLLGTGVLGAAGMLRKRFVKA